MPKASESTPMIALRDGAYEYRFVCHSEKERRRAQRLFDKEEGTIAWIREHLRPDDVFYDIGANIGTYTVFAGCRLGVGGKVIAFEPHVPNASSLIENAVLNRLESTVQLVTAALTNHEGYARFNYLSTLVSTSTSQYGTTSYAGESFEPKFVEIKHGCTIDLLWRLKLIAPPDLIKIDVDGLELDVLGGMRELLASSERPRSMQVELDVDSADGIIRFCEALGYVLTQRHWTQAGRDAIARGAAAESQPHNAVFSLARTE